MLHAHSPLNPDDRITSSFRRPLLTVQLFPQARVKGVIASSSGSSDEIVNATNEASEHTVEALSDMAQGLNLARDASNEEDSHGNQKNSSARRKRRSMKDENEVAAKKAKSETKSGKTSRLLSPQTADENSTRVFFPADVFDMILLNRNLCSYYSVLLLKLWEFALQRLGKVEP